DWVEQRQRRTWRGRAQLRLAERAGSWNAYRERRLLPSWTEWIMIGMLTPHRAWTEPERCMMQAATRYHGTGTLLWALAFGVIALVSFYVAGEVRERRNSDRADILLADLRHHPHAGDVDAKVRELDQYEPWVVPKLHDFLRQPGISAEDRLH